MTDIHIASFSYPSFGLFDDMSMAAGDAEDIGQLPQQENAAYSRTESRRNQPAMVFPRGIFTNRNFSNNVGFLFIGRFGQYGDLCWRKRINWQRPNWPPLKSSKRK